MLPNILQFPITVRNIPSPLRDLQHFLPALRDLGISLFWQFQIWNNFEIQLEIHLEVQW